MPSMSTLATAPVTSIDVAADESSEMPMPPAPVRGPPSDARPPEPPDPAPCAPAHEARPAARRELTTSRCTSEIRIPHAYHGFRRIDRPDLNRKTGRQKEKTQEEAAACGVQVTG